MPETPASYTLTTLFPRASAVIAASSATGMSLVPAVMTVIFPMSCFSGNLPASAILLVGSYVSGTDPATKSAVSRLMRVMMMHFSPCSSILPAIPAICSGVLPAPNMTSVTPWRTPR